MEYSNKELNEIREAGYNHGYDVGYKEQTKEQSFRKNNKEIER